MKLGNDFTGFLSGPGHRKSPRWDLRGHSAPLQTTRRCGRVWWACQSAFWRWGRALSPPPPVVWHVSSCRMWFVFFSLAVPLRQTLPWRSNGRGYVCSRDLCRVCANQLVGFVFTKPLTRWLASFQGVVGEIWIKFRPCSNGNKRLLVAILL